MSIGVLVVDDSALMRALLQCKLEAEPDISVIGTAGDAIEARAKIKQLNPDVVTLDIEMPGMDGLSFLEKIMTLRPTPVIIVSGSTGAGATATAQALRLGAVHCYAKNTAERSLRDDDGGELAGLVREAAAIDFSKSTAAHRRQANPGRTQTNAALNRPPSLIAIGASTGGVEALHSLLAQFPANCPPTLIVQHINACFASAITASLDRVTKANVVSATHDLPLRAGMIGIAPDNDRHLTLASDVDGRFRCQLAAGNPVSGHRPSVDRLFHSVAENARDKAMGLLLTGMGKDGAEGMLAMAQNGAQTVAQDEASCVIFGMPRAAIAIGAAREILPLGDIAGRIFSRMDNAV